MLSPRRGLGRDQVFSVVLIISLKVVLDDKSQLADKCSSHCTAAALLHRPPYDFLLKLTLNVLN